MRYLMYWWIFLCLQLTGVVIAGMHGIFGKAYAADLLNIPFLIMACWVGATIHIGVMTAKRVRLQGYYNPHENGGWFMAEVVMLLGMIGTVVGFIHMTTEALGNGVDQSQLTHATQQMARGIGTSGWSTLFGLISCLCIKVQMNNLEKLIQHES